MRNHRREIEASGRAGRPSSWAIISDGNSSSPDYFLVAIEGVEMGKSHTSQYFCADRNIVTQAVIPGHRQSLGETERSQAHFRGIMEHISGRWDLSKITFMHLDSQVPKYDGLHVAEWYLREPRKCQLSRRITQLFRFHEPGRCAGNENARFKCGIRGYPPVFGGSGYCR